MYYDPSRPPTMPSGRRRDPNEWRPDVLPGSTLAISVIVVLITTSALADGADAFDGARWPLVEEVVLYWLLGVAVGLVAGALRPALRSFPGMMLVSAVLIAMIVGARALATEPYFWKMFDVGYAGLMAVVGVVAGIHTNVELARWKVRRGAVRR